MNASYGKEGSKILRATMLQILPGGRWFLPIARPEAGTIILYRRTATGRKDDWMMPEKVN
ncbi:MAG: hypothetical protein E3J72_01710 [Planctomycetota bacterium]|nr:MAG: hypothetical protein E3J72_01710 [Planctomycetota bacterium]